MLLLTKVFRGSTGGAMLKIQSAGVVEIVRGVRKLTRVIDAKKRSTQVS